MELLIIKTGTAYLRVKPEGFFTVGLDKASVFPMDKLDHVRTLEKKARAQGFSDVRIKKLILTERDL